MALQFIDSFDHYHSGTSIDPPWQIMRKWDQKDWVTALIFVDNINPRRPGGRHLKFSPNPSVTPYVQKYFTTLKKTIVIGFALKVEAYSSWCSVIAFIRKGVATCSVQIEEDGSITVRKGDYTGTILGQSAIVAIPLNAWFYFEVKVYIDDTGGTFDVRVEEDSILSGSGVDTQNETSQGADSVMVSGRRSGTAYYSYVDDLYIDDAEFHGDCRIDPLWPNGIGSHSDLTPEPSGDNFENADDRDEIDDDSTYNVTDVINAIDTYEFEDIENIPDTEILAVALNLCERTDDAGPRKFKGVCRMDDEDFLGSEHDFYDTYKVSQHIWETPPNNPSGIWTEEDINDAEFGIKLTV